MGICNLCQKNPAASSGLCPECMTKLGVVEMPPARRKASPCGKCNGLKFVRVIPREHTISEGGDWNYPQIAPMTLTQLPSVTNKLFGKGMAVGHPSIVHGRGRLETFTCLACGYVEWWCEDPKEIPIGPQYMSELVDYGPDAPYR